MNDEAKRDVVYSERLQLLSNSLLLLGLIVSASLLLYGFFNSIAAFMVGLISMPFIIMFLSANRYTKITVTKSELRVGQASIALERIDHAYGLQALSSLADSRDSKYIYSPLPVPSRSSVQILGGSWGLPQFFSEPAVNKLNDSDKFYVVFTRNAPELKRVLSSAIVRL